MVGLVLIWGEPVFVCLPTFQFFSRAIAQACRTTQWLRTWPQSGESWERFISHALPSWLQEQLLFNACLQIHLATDWQLSIPSRSPHPQLLGVLSSKAWDDVPDWFRWNLWTKVGSRIQHLSPREVFAAKPNDPVRAWRVCFAGPSRHPFCLSLNLILLVKAVLIPPKPRPQSSIWATNLGQLHHLSIRKNWPLASTTLWASADFSSTHGPQLGLWEHPELPAVLRCHRIDVSPYIAKACCQAIWSDTPYSCRSL